MKPGIDLLDLQSRIDDHAYVLGHMRAAADALHAALERGAPLDVVTKLMEGLNLALAERRKLEL